MSERQEQRRIESSAGTGKVTQDGVMLGPATYVMEIWQTFHIIKGFGAGPAEEVAGLREIHIRLVNHSLDTFKLSQDQATLTLHLQDERQIEGFLDGEDFMASGQLTSA